MPAPLRAKLSFANVVSVLALFVALGGGAYAAATVNSADVVNNSIKSKDVKNNNIKGIDVKERSLAAVCPANAPSLADNVCYGAQHAGVGAEGDWDVAARQCATENLRLPSIGEALSVTDSVNTGDTFIWTDEFGTEAATRILIRTNDAGFSRIASGPKAGPRPYRCVTSAR
jgi:hypothetical protein